MGCEDGYMYGKDLETISAIAKCVGGIAGAGFSAWGAVIVSSTLTAQIGWGITAGIFGATVGAFAGPFIVMAGIAVVTGALSVPAAGIAGILKGIEKTIKHIKNPNDYKVASTAQKLSAQATSTPTKPSVTQSSTLDTVLAGIEKCNPEQRDLFLGAWVKKFPADFNKAADMALEERHIAAANKNMALANDLDVSKVKRIKFIKPKPKASE